MARSPRSTLHTRARAQSRSGAGRGAAVGDDRGNHGPTHAVDECHRPARPSRDSGLNDSHTHPIRGGLHYNMELRWDGVRSLADGLEDVARSSTAHTGAPMGAHRRRLGRSFSLPNDAGRRSTRSMPRHRIRRSSSTIFTIVHGSMARPCVLSASRKDTADKPGGRIERDKRGNPTGLIIAQPNALILYSTLAKGPEACVRGSAELHAALPARAQSFRNH